MGKLRSPVCATEVPSRTHSGLPCVLGGSFEDLVEVEVLDEI